MLGCGLDITYPPENESLFRQIAGDRAAGVEPRGAVISEYAFGTPPLADNFPRRNRIVSGMSRGVLVIEADERSGALITARQACDDHGRPVFALPGRVDNYLSVGPHQLIRDGAVLAARLEDILDNLGPLPQGALEPEFIEPSPKGQPSNGGTTPVPSANQGIDGDVAFAGLSDRQRAILLSMSATQPADIETIIDRTGLPAPTILQELTFLTLKGQAKRIDGQTFVRRHA